LREDLINYIIGILLFIPIIAYAIAFLLSRGDLAASTAIANFGMPLIIIETILTVAVIVWRNHKLSKVTAKR
jgi:hypothetical protein